MSDSESEGHPETSINGTGHNFLTIPPELAELIFEHVDDSTLISLRSVSRETARRVETRFLKECFGQRAFLLSSEDSLRALLSIVEIDKLARALKTIDLCIEEIPDPYVGEEHALELNQATVRGLPNALDAVQTWHLREHYSRFQKQAHDREQNVDLHLLTMIFSRLRRLHHLPGVRIVDQYEAYDYPWGKATLEFLTKAQLEAMEDSQRLIPVVVEAVALSGMPLESLVVRYTESEWEWTLTDLTASPKRALYTKDVFSSLRKLHVMSDRWAIFLDADTETFVEILATANLVEDLSLQIRAAQGDRYGSYLDMVDGRCKCLSNHLPKLKCLDLQGYSFTLVQMRTIITRHPDLVKIHFHASVELHHAYLDPKYKDSPSELSDRYYMPASSLSQERHLSWLGDRLIAPCTLLEIAVGKDEWDKELLRLRRIEEEKADAAIERIMALRRERELLLTDPLRRGLN